MSWGDAWGTSPGRDSVRCAAATRMYDFIKHKGLFGELLEFTRKWK